MLKLKPNCECCDKDLPPSAADARICTFECTFCAECATDLFGGFCPNCGGNLVERPIRSVRHLVSAPASTERFTKVHSELVEKSKRDLSHIINWRSISQRISLSGQPTESQLAEISELGVSHVINLGPHHNKGALADEAGTVATLGMEYVYIPVEFENPTDENFADFCAALDRLKDKKIHVHCIYNARVSAFFYRYAKAGLGDAGPKILNEAFALMDGIWRPGSDWAEFIGNPEAAEKPNLYAGDDY